VAEVAHSGLTGANLHVPFHYIQDADPGAVGAGKFWLDTNSGPPLKLYRRNAGDAGWDEIGPTAASALTVQEEDGTPIDTAVTIIRVTNGTLTDNGAGDVSLNLSGGGGGAPTTAPYVTTVADGGLSAEVVIPGLAGSPDIAGAAGGGTVVEEYDSATTGLTWSPSSPASVDSDTTLQSHLYVRATDTTERFGYRAWVPGSGAFDARCHLSGASETAGPQSLGLMIANSDNTTRLLLQASPGNNGSGTNGLGYYIQAYTYAASTFTQRGSSWPWFSPYLRISRDGSNNVSFWHSTDGKVWVLLATVSFTLTVAQIGHRVVAASGGAAVMVSDWLRTSV
jgi:hypothetical protein